MRESFRALRLLIGTSFRADPRVAFFSFLLEPLSNLMSLFFGLWMKLLADAAIAGDLRRGIAGAVGMALSMGGFLLAAGVGVRLRLTLEEKTGFEFDRRIAQLTAGIPTLEHHERPEYLDKMELLRQSQANLGHALGSVVQGVGLVFRTAGIVVLLASVHPLLLLLPVFGLPTLWAGGSAARRAQDSEDATAEPRRAARHLLELATQTGPGKEMRVFRLHREIVRRERELWMDAHRVRAAARWSGAIRSAIAWGMFGLGFAAAIAFVVWLATRSRATPGDVLLTITVAAEVNSQLSWAANIIAWVLQELRVAARFLWLIDYADQHRRPIETDVVVPDRLRDGITVENLSFRYPGTEAWVLRDVSLRLPAGSTVALVGENGAGKTTLVKLLCRFYEPTEGRILVDGAPLERFDVESWRSRVSSAFQDFCRFELVARETVGIGDLPRIDAEPVVQRALVRAGAAEVPSRLPAGLDTQLGPQWDGGVDISTGQWQKLALGRALMRDEPLLVVFDEPTASLDAQTEHALFERFAQAAREGRGALTVLVSHRFSTVRMADVIVVIDGGRVVESGSHEELMARGGLYAELFSLQARAYR